MLWLLSSHFKSKNCNNSTGKKVSISRSKKTIPTVVVFSNRRPEVVEEPNGAFL